MKFVKLPGSGFMPYPNNLGLETFGYQHPVNKNFDEKTFNLCKFENQIEKIMPVKQKINKDKNLLRINRKAIMLNNKELGAFNYYCKKYRVANQSKFIRETIMIEILRKFEDDHPKLFECEQLRLF